MLAYLNSPSSAPSAIIPEDECLPYSLQHQFNFVASQFCVLAFSSLLLLPDANSFSYFHHPSVHSRLTGLNGISNPTNILIPSVTVLKSHHMILAWLTLLKGNYGAACSICRTYYPLEPSFLSQNKICGSIIISTIGHSSAFWKYTCGNYILLPHDGFDYVPTDEYLALNIL